MTLVTNSNLPDTKINIRDTMVMKPTTKNQNQQQQDQNKKKEKANPSSKDVLDANQKLLNSIASCSYGQYKKLCSPDMTCFEPESNGMLVEGLNFHKYYFDLGTKINANKNKKNREGDADDADDPSSSASLITMKTNITMSQPHVRWIGKECAVVSYTRIDQILQQNNNGGQQQELQPITKTMSETRIWQVQQDGSLVHVHFHKS